MKISKNGFTLVELLLVITILVILGLAAFIGINPLVQILRGYDTVRKSDLKKIQTAYETYYEDNGCYPPLTDVVTTDKLGNPVHTSKSILENCNGTDLQPYLDKIPCDPATKTPYSNLIKVDDSLSCPQSYNLNTKLANKFDTAGQTLVDPYISSTVNCAGIYSLYAGMSKFEATNSCAGLCTNGYYGCVNGTCQLIAPKGEMPTCKPNYCISNCSNGCTEYNDNGDVVVNEGNRCVP